MRLRDGTVVADRRLGRCVSETTEHLDRYPLTAATLPSAASSMVIGTNWYRGLDKPVRRRVHGTDRWVLGDGALGGLRGGHATCLRHWTHRDAPSWWAYYDQGSEGRCVEFALLRMASLHNRRRYDITSSWHYWTAQRLDEWDGGTYPGAKPRYEGTSVRAGLEVARLSGLVRELRTPRRLTETEAAGRVSAEDGIAAYRWATSWQDVRTVLGVPDWLPGVPLLNSWGTAWPREVLLLDAVGERLLAEDGEFGVPTDR